MKLLTLVPAIALAAALATPAFAVSINGVELTEQQLTIVTQHCETLAASEAAQDNSVQDSNSATAVSQSDSESESASVQGETGVAGDLAGIDLDTVNLAVCAEAGL